MRIVTLTVALAAAPILAAQTTPTSVRGVAYDSLHAAPLADAFVTMNGGGKTRSATSDTLGRFHFDSVGAGTYVFSMQHAAVDSLGFPGLSTRATIGSGHEDVRISIPSFATLWRAACGPTRAPADSGFVHGVVRDAATQKPVAGATIDLSWIDVSMDKDKHLSQRRWRNQSRTDANGSYAVCPVPADATVQVQGLSDTTASGVINLVPNGSRVQRRDLFLGPTATNSGLRGTVAGVLTGAAGSPFRDARVILEAMPEVRSGADGRFTIRDVPVGTRQLEVIAIGMAPVVMVVDVLPNDTALVTAEIRKATVLTPVKVTATARQREFNRELEERKRSGFGHMMDSTKLEAMGSMATVFGNFPGARVVRPPNGGSRDFVVRFPAGIQDCTAIVWVDGRRSDFDQLKMYEPQDIGLVEVYSTRMTVPDRFRDPYHSCGALVVWTKYSMK